MSTEVSENNNTAAEGAAKGAGMVQLNGLFAFKKGMSSIYSEEGEVIPVTVLEYKPCVVSQVKTSEKDGYEAVQLACDPRKPKQATHADRGHFKASGWESGAKHVMELRQSLPEGVKAGDKLALSSLAVGDTVQLTARSKGRGFSGVIKRWNFGGGPAAHGSKFHRQPGSIGNRTWPGRVMPGRKMAGHFGFEKITVKSVKVVGISEEDGVILVKGPVPGGTNTLVKLMKV